MPRLHEAVIAGDLKEVNRLILMGDDVNDMSYTAPLDDRTPIEKGFYKMSPLHLAAYYGHTQIAQRLIEGSADLDKVMGYLLVIERPESTDNVRHNLSLESALEIAIKRDHFGVASLLIEAGAKDENNRARKKLSSRDVFQQVWKAAEDNKPEVIREIYDEGQLTKEVGENALKNAVQFNNFTIAKLLILEYGVSVNAYSVDKPTTAWCYHRHYNKTPLGVAIEYGHEAMVEYLLEHDADVDQFTGERDYTPLCLALTKEKISVHLLQLLFDYGTDGNKINRWGWDSLLENGLSQQVLDLFFIQGLNPNLICDGTRLLEIFFSASLDLADHLIKAGADVHFLDNNGQSYLHRSGDVRLTEFLVGLGLDIELKDILGKTPIEYVDTQSKEFLSKKGASIKALSLFDEESSFNQKILASPLLIERLLAEQLIDFNATDHYGRTLLHELVCHVVGDFAGYLKTLTFILKNVPGLDVQQATKKGRTLLHAAFHRAHGSLTCMHNSNDGNLDDDRHVRAINLLISYGAQPIKDIYGRTPLMCCGEGSRYCDLLIKRYHAFEARHYKLDPASYLREFETLKVASHQNGRYRFFENNNSDSPPPLNPVERFWTRIESAKNNANNHLNEHQGSDHNTQSGEELCLR